MALSTNACKSIALSFAHEHNWKGLLNYAKYACAYKLKDTSTLTSQTFLPLIMASDQPLGSSLLRKVGPDEVFNLPLYEHHLVIDIRSSERYKDGHMATAVSFPCPPLQ